MGKFDRVLFASDFDNTLIYTADAFAAGTPIPSLGARNREALGYFIANGGLFAVSTGRALPAFAAYAEGLPCNAPCVIANGAALYDFASEKYIYTAALSAQVYAHVDELLARFPNLSFEIYHEGYRIHALHPNRFIESHAYLTGTAVTPIASFREAAFPILKLLFEDEQPVLQEVYSYIMSREWAKEYELIFSHAHLLEMTAHGADKGGMVLRLAEMLGVPRQNIYCAGDHLNDLPMLRIAEIGFAPENCVPEVRQWGAHIVSHSRDGAIADVVGFLDRRYESGAF